MSDEDDGLAEPPGAPTPTVRGISVRFAEPDDVAGLRQLWLYLHHHHRALVHFLLQPDDEVSWQVRQRTYLTALGDGTAFILVAREAYEPVGYLTVMLRPGGPDDTFDLGPTYAEIYSLVVSPDQRSRGIGSLLLQTALDELERRGVKDLNVAVMSGNADAVRFYQRYGLVPAELHLWKFASSELGDQT